MLPLANTKISVLRGTGNDPYGDQIDVMTPFETDVPALAGGDRADSVRSCNAGAADRAHRQCYVPPWLDVLNTDQVYDQLTGDTFMVIDIVAQPWHNPGGSRLTTLKLRRVSAAAP